MARSEVIAGVIVGLTVAVLAGWAIIEIWHRLGGPDKDDP